MPKKITVDMLINLKKEQKFQWTWANQAELPPQRLRSFDKAKGRTEFYLTCGGCNIGHWVLWSELKRQRTSACRSCARAPSVSDMREIGKNLGSSYNPTHQWKMVKDRRYVLMQCSCGAKKWVGWNRFQQGLAVGCKSCRSPLRKHGRGHSPLHVTWSDLNRRHADDMVSEWKIYEAFESWAKNLYELGWKLIRIDSSLPYGPDNCDYVPIRRKNIPETIEFTLPIGNSKLPAFRKTA